MIAFELLVGHLPPAPKRWGKWLYGFGNGLVKKNTFLTLWQIQSTAALPVTLAIVAGLDWAAAFAVSCFWAVSAVWAYEWALDHGQKELLQVEGDGLAGTINWLYRLWSFGWPQPVAIGFHRSGVKQFLPARMMMHALALAFFGVVAFRYHFSSSGFSKKGVFRLNVLGRFSNSVSNVTLGVLIVHLTRPYWDETVHHLLHVIPFWR